MYVFMYNIHCLNVTYIKYITCITYTYYYILFINTLDSIIESYFKFFTSSSVFSITYCRHTHGKQTHM